jgi:Leucine-rich repeat (LRR) protein
LIRTSPMTVLINETFRNCVNLQMLQISKTDIDTIEPMAFMGLKSLTNLILSPSKLTSLPLNVFKMLESLKIIDISKNMLTSIDASLFASSPALSFVNLQENNISELPPNIFQNVLKLGSFYVNNNQLKSVSTYGATYFDANFNQLSSVELIGGESTIHASNNALTKIICPNITNLSVQRLYMQNNSLTSFLCIRDMVNLTDLDVSGNNMRKPTRKVFAKLINLKSFKIDSMKKFVSIAAKTFADLKSLRNLYVSRMPAYKYVKQFIPSLYLLGLTTTSWNCSHVQFVADTLGGLGITLVYNNVADRQICNVKQNVSKI